MNIQTNELTGHTRDLLLTEAMFFVASARSVNADLIKLKIKREENKPVSEKELAQITRILRSLKRRKLIQLFVTPDEFQSHTTEIEYLLNIYPKLPIELGDDYHFVIKL